MDRGLNLLKKGNIVYVLRPGDQEKHNTIEYKYY